MLGTIEDRRRRYQRVRWMEWVKQMTQLGLTESREAVFDTTN